MAGASISIDYEFNDQRIIDALKRLERAGADMEPAFMDIGESLLNSHRDRWDQQVSPDGEAWEPLSEKYRARKKKNKDKILVLEGFTRDTLSYNSFNDGLELGTNRTEKGFPFPIAHQLGSEKNNLPARPFLGLSEADEQMIMDTLEDHFDLALRG